MSSVFERYGIDESLSVDTQLTLLEKERQKTLRKLNHVFGNPEKEKELSEDLNRLDAVIDQLERAGGKQLSMEDVKLETKALSQTMLTFSEEEEAMKEKEAEEIAKLAEIRKLQVKVMKAKGNDIEVSVPGLRRIADFYESKKAYGSLETWLTYGAQWIPHPYFTSRLYQFLRSGLNETADSGKRLLWCKRAADMGDKDACYELACHYFDKNQSNFNAEEAAYYFAKAADQEHPEAYLYAFQAFVVIKDYERAGICLNEAERKGLRKQWPADCIELKKYLERE